jgi:hypothetical protein
MPRFTSIPHVGCCLEPGHARGYFSSLIQIHKLHSGLSNVSDYGNKHRLANINLKKCFEKSYLDLFQHDFRLLK